MSDLPVLIQALSDTDQSAEIMMGGEQFATPAALLAAYPALAEPGNAVLLARAVTHLAQAGQFRVVEDPAAFRAAYDARIASEDPKQPWRRTCSGWWTTACPTSTGSRRPRSRTAGSSSTSRTT